MRATLEQLIAAERVDIVHAYDAGAAWSARLAAAQIAVWLVTTLPDVPSYTGLRGRYCRRARAGRPDHRAVELRGRADHGALRHARRADHRRSARHRHRDLRSRRGVAGARRRAARALAGRAGRADRAGARAAWRRGTARCCCRRSRASLVDDGVRGFRLRRRRRERDARRNTRATSLKRAQAHRTSTTCSGSPAIAPTCRPPSPPPTSSRCPRSSRRCSAAWSRRRRPWRGRWSPPTSACCRSMSWRRRACRKTCAPAGWRAPAIRPTSRARSTHALSLDATAYRGDVGARARIRRIHVFPGQRCRRHAGGLYLAAGARYLSGSDGYRQTAAARRRTSSRRCGESRSPPQSALMHAAGSMRSHDASCRINRGSRRSRRATAAHRADRGAEPACRRRRRRRRGARAHPCGRRSSSDRGVERRPHGGRRHGGGRRSSSR